MHARAFARDSPSLRPLIYGPRSIRLLRFVKHFLTCPGSGRNLAVPSRYHANESFMDLTGYGYKRPGQQTRITAQPVAAPVRSPELSVEAGRLLDAVGARVALIHLPSRFPRVLNRIASLWNRPTITEQCFEELLLDSRGARSGFPPEVLSELVLLRTLNSSRLFPPKVDPWQEMHLR